MEDQIILVDTADNVTGSCGKQEAHEKGLLHRAFSIFIFRKILKDNPDGTRTFHVQLLIQRRAAGKYHSAGLWANSCCSHPRKNESMEEAIVRRLTEETGLTVSGTGGNPGSSADSCSSADVTGLEEMGAFRYRAEFENGLTENEFDHVFAGWIDPAKAGQNGEGVVLHPDPEEADEMCFRDVDEIMNDVLTSPSKYAAWFMPALLIATDGQEFGSLNREASDRIMY